jgi:hypothetical protein
MGCVALDIPQNPLCRLFPPLYCPTGLWRKPTVSYNVGPCRLLTPPEWWTIMLHRQAVKKTHQSVIAAYVTISDEATPSENDQQWAYACYCLGAMARLRSRNARMTGTKEVKAWAKLHLPGSFSSPHICGKTSISVRQWKVGGADTSETISPGWMLSVICRSGC